MRRSPNRWFVLVITALSLLIGMGVSACATTVAASGSGNTAGAATGSPAAAAGPPVLRGVNVYDLPWYSSYHKTWDGEPQSSYDFLAAHGIKLVRLPFMWPDLQPTLGGPLDTHYLGIVEQQVQRAGNAGISVILDLHGDCEYPNPMPPQGDTDPDQVSCGHGISEQQVDDTWLKLSKVFKGNKTIAGYDIMNEPNGISVATWQAYSQSVVTALRGAGDDTLLWIEGANWSQAEQWTQFQPTPWIHDPANNFMYSAHQYFVQYSNYPQGYDFGQYASFEQQVLSGLKSFTDWLAKYDVRGSIGEVGWPNSKETSSWQDWNALAEKWYELADAAHLWVTYFSATSVYDEAQDAYDAPHNSDGCRSHATPGPTCRPPGISVAESQASVIQAHPSTG